MVSIRRELRGYGLSPRKRLGQHFLIDKNILNKLIREASLGSDDVILEVGPGLGEMTLALAKRAKSVIAIEIDSKLVEILRTKFENTPNVEIIEGYILKVDFSRLFRQAGRPLKVVANLPYQISTPLLFRFIEEREFFSDLYLMLQKEVVERMIALPGKKEYGPLSIFIQIFSIPSLLFFIKPSSFFPPPKVESAVVHVVWREKPLLKFEDEEWFKKVVRGCFSYRRKKLINALRYSNLSFPQDIGERIEKMGINPMRRPETLTVEEFKKLADGLKFEKS